MEKDNKNISMEITEMKKKLLNYTYIIFKIDSINEEIRDLASNIESQRDVKSKQLTAMPKGYEKSDPVAIAVEKIIDVYSSEYSRLENELKILLNQKSETEKLLNSLDELEKKVIEYKYFKKYKWWMVANAIGYSESDTKRRCRKILEKMINEKDGTLWYFLYVSIRIIKYKLMKRRSKLSAFCVLIKLLPLQRRVMEVII